MHKRELTDLDDIRLIHRGNKILSDLFSKSIHSIRQLSSSEADAKGFYRFLQNDRVSEDDIVMNLSSNCKAACAGKYVVCIQDTTEINLSSHSNRIKKDDYIGSINKKENNGLGFMLHPSLVLDSFSGVPYGYSDVKIWNRPLVVENKFERKYQELPIAEKESYKWLEVSKNTKAALADIVKGMVIIQDREGDIYEQFATIVDDKTDLLIRAKSNRTLADKSKLFDCLSNQEPQGYDEIMIDSSTQNKRPKRKAKLAIRFKDVTLCKTYTSSKDIAPTTTLSYIEVTEIDYEGKDKICWRLLTSIPVTNIDVAKMCITWYSWRWTIEEVFKIVKKEGYNIEASELEYAASIRKLTLLMLEVIIKLFLMRIAYNQPEEEIAAEAVFTKDEVEFMEHQIVKLEGKTEKQKNPYLKKDLKRYVWAIARLGGWKGYESKRTPGITTLWIGLKKFKNAKEGWDIHKNVSTR
jgi:Transposase DNA-binding/Transposase DDE domain